MTNQQGAPEALRLAAEVLDWMPTSDTQRALWDRHQKALVVVKAALVEAQQPAPSAAAAVTQQAEETAWLRENDAPQPYPTPQADSQPAPVAAFEVADAIADSQYLAGVSAGWNAANADDPNAALQKLHESRAGYLKPLRAARAPADSVTAPAGGVVAGIEAAAKLLERKADDFARENGSDDLGSLSFGRGAHADAKLEYHSTLLELAEEIRSLAPPPPAQAADSVLEDAARWQALPAFFEEYQIDAMKLYRDIDAYLDAARKQGANHD